MPIAERMLERTKEISVNARRMGAVASLALLTAALAACGTAPLSVLDGRPPHLLPPEHYPVHIVSIDGQIEFHQPVQVAPDAHYLVAQAVGGKSARGNLQKSFVFRVAPCTRYYFAAARKSPMDADWDLVVQETEAVTGCNADEELKKAKAAGVPS
jgi:hypothetical protein